MTATLEPITLEGLQAFLDLFALTISVRRQKGEWVCVLQSVTTQRTGLKTYVDGVIRENLLTGLNELVQTYLAYSAENMKGQ